MDIILSGFIISDKGLSLELPVVVVPPDVSPLVPLVVVVATPPVVVATSPVMLDVFEVKLDSIASAFC